MVEDGKYEFFPWGKVSFSKLIASVRQEFFVEKKLYRLGGIPQVLNMWMFELCSNIDTKVAVTEGNNIPRILNWRVVAVRPQYNQFMTRMFIKCSYSNIVPNVEELEKLELPPNSFASDHPGTVSGHLSKSEKDVPVGRRLENKEQNQTQALKEKQTATNAEQKSKEIDDSTRINRKVLLVKADLDSLESNIKTYVKTYIDMKFSYLERVMNDRFTDILKSLQLKNETVEKENVTKESHKEGHRSDDVADFEGNSDPDDGIEKLSDITVEEIKPINIIFPVQEHEMALTIYKPPPTTPDEYMISDTTIVSVFPTPIKTVSEVKKTPS
ncbi:hypothetical protein CQW23_06328 [Capsicum baccatum]|uniref:DUF1985 domain-containing protein n=1 Tax=Capsicum baccatum TaxID=33114 RepID=A0A2G2X2Z7_CAPBA|nr:hypothetical protein CQW23_06328 [Capsicum baccatum]